jgi:hypothetical protein
VVLDSSAVVERECDGRATSMRASKKSPRTISRNTSLSARKVPISSWVDVSRPGRFRAMAQQFSKENETTILIILNTLRPPQTPHTPRAPTHLGWLWRLMRVLKRRGNDPQAEPFLKPLAVAQARVRRNDVTKTYSGRITLIQGDVGVQSRTDSKWSRVAAGGLECYRIPGRHRGILEDSRLQETAQVLQQCLQNFKWNQSRPGVVLSRGVG